MKLDRVTNEGGWALPTLLLLGLVVLVFGNSLGGTFHYDDEHSIIRNESIRSVEAVPRYFTDLSAFSGDEGKGMYRPLLLLTYAANYALHDYDAFGYHVVNMMLHGICVILLWRLGLMLWSERKQEALLGAALFAVHPLAAEPVNYVSSRSEVLMACFFLGTLLLHLQGRDRRARWGARLCFLLALLSKETSIVLMPILLFLDVVSEEGSLKKPALAALIRRHVFYWVTAMVYLLVLVWTGFLGAGESGAVRPMGTQALTQLKALVYYVQLLVLPHLLSVDHGFSVSTQWSWAVGGATALTATAGWVLIRGRRLWPQLMPGAVIGWLVLLPTSIIPLNVLVNERRIYLVLAAACLAVPQVLRLRLTRKALICVVVLALLTVQRNQVWATPLQLWEDALARGSRSYTCFVNLGKAKQAAGDRPGAVAAYEQALRIDDRKGDVYNNLAVLLHEEGRPHEAIRYYLAALERAPYMEEIHHNLAVAYQEVGDLPAAAQAFGRALELEPANGGLWSNFGQLLLTTGDPEAAQGAYEEALRLLGERPEPLNGLGNAFSALQRPQEAVVVYQRALAAGPDVAQRTVILTNLGESYMRLGATEAAVEVLREAEALSPNATTLDYLGRIALASGDTARAWHVWQQALSLQADRKVPLIGLGEIALTRGRLDTAHVLLQRAVEVGGGDRAQRALRRLERIHDTGPGR